MQWSQGYWEMLGYMFYLEEVFWWGAKWCCTEDVWFDVGLNEFKPSTNLLPKEKERKIKKHYFNLAFS